MYLAAKQKRALFNLYVALVATAVAAALRTCCLAFLGSHVPFVTFLPAVLFLIFFVGVSAGALAALFSVTFVVLTLDHPLQKVFVTRDLADRVVLMASTALCVLICLLGVLRQRSQKRREEAKSRAEFEEQIRLSELRFRQVLITQEENLRTRIATELHDDVAQVGTALGLNLSFIASALGEEVPGEVATRLEESRRLTKEISRSVRNLMVDLRPVQLDEYGLEAALRSHVEQYAQRFGVEVELAADRMFPRLSLQQEMALFRIVQEALVNVVRHAGATRVRIALVKERGRVVVSITDDGKGFDPGKPCQPTAESGWGLSIMRERAELAGGRFELRTAPGEGVAISVFLPE